MGRRHKFYKYLSQSLIVNNSMGCSCKDGWMAIADQDQAKVLADNSVKFATKLSYAKRRPNLRTSFFECRALASFRKLKSCLLKFRWCLQMYFRTCSVFVLVLEQVWLISVVCWILLPFISISSQCYLSESCMHI